MMIPLTQIDEKCSFVVCTINGERFFRCRLMEMGFTPGIMAEMMRNSLSSDPIEFSVRGGLISIRRSDAENIFVRKVHT